MGIKRMIAVAALCVASILSAAPLKMDWKATPDAPSAVARPFAGLLGKTMIVAGGSTYEGTKAYSSTIATYDPVANVWQQVGTLPEGIAEGAAVAVNLGTSVSPDWRLICVGGVTAQGASAKAFLLKADGTQEALPDFPHGTLSMTAVAAWENGAVFACGRLNGELTNRIFTLTRKDGVWTWGELEALPGPAREQAVAAVQNGDQKSLILVVYGGSILAEDGKPMADKKGWGYTKTFDGTWAWKALEEAPVSTIGATFTAIGDQHLLLVGGYTGQLWDAANRMKPELWQQMLAAEPKAFSWNRTVWAYHTVTGKWAEYGELPEDVLPRCGAATVVLPAEGKVMPKLVIAGGEIKPAKRTAATHVVSFTRQGWAFSWLSWVVIGVYFLAMVGMAMIFVLRQKTADSYFRGGKSIPWFVAGMSIFATMLSSITFISIPTMTYIGDWRYFPMVLCILAMAPIAIYFYLPFFCRLNITSAYEYLEKRFNLSIRLFGSAVFNIFMVCRVAVVTLLPALALDAVTGIGVENCILICGVATILYCCVGGLDAVIWSDFVQGIVLLGGAVTVLVLLIVNTNGGFTGFVDIAQEHDKLRLLDFRFLLKEPVFWVVVIQGVVSNLSSYTSDQCVVQRYIACTNEKKAASSIWFNGVLSVIASIIFYAIGTGLYTHYFSNPGLMDVTMPKSDSVFPIFMAIELHPVVAGLVIAAIFAATISTLSANLTSASTAITTDFVLRFKPSLTGPQQVKCGRICVIVIGILGVGAALTLAQLPTRSLFDEFQKFIAMLTAGLTALFFMGIFMPRVGGIPAVIGLLANYFVCYGLDLIPAGSALSVIKPHPFVYGGIGLVVCVLIAWALSLVFPNQRETTGLTHFSRPKEEA
ncbi:MAG: sodium/solute symporter [Kiritimatiellae bacterium]|nr:sodium/solute symporter [Kiritimatiellia bacterium]